MAAGMEDLYNILIYFLTAAIPFKWLQNYATFCFRFFMSLSFMGSVHNTNDHDDPIRTPTWDKSIKQTHPTMMSHNAFPQPACHKGKQAVSPVFRRPKYNNNDPAPIGSYHCQPTFMPLFSSSIKKARFWHQWNPLNYPWPFVTWAAQESHAFGNFPRTNCLLEATQVH